MPLRKNLVDKIDEATTLDLNQGDCIQLLNREDVFQVIGVDIEHKRCWVRRWPLLPKGSPVFEISIQQVSTRTEFSKECPISNT